TRFTGLEHLGGPLNGLDHDADFRPDGFDVERGSVPSVALDRNPLEIHQQPSNAAVRAFHRTPQGLFEHGPQSTQIFERSEFTMPRHYEFSMLRLIGSTSRFLSGWGLLP